MIKYVLLLSFFLGLQLNSSAQFFIGTWEGKHFVNIKSKAVTFSGDIRFIVSFEDDKSYSIYPKNEKFKPYVNLFNGGLLDGYNIIKRRREYALIQLNYRTLNRREHVLCDIEKTGIEQITIKFKDEEEKDVIIRLIKVK